MWLWLWQFLRGGGIATQVFQQVNAKGWNGLVYSVNGTSANASGNVNVLSVDGNTVDSEVPSSANFTQYSANGTQLAGVNSLVGNGDLDTDATNITDAINELNGRIDDIDATPYSYGIDASNIIATNPTLPYTATEDCYAYYYIHSNTGTARSVTVDGVVVAGHNNVCTNSDDISGIVFLKRGQTIDTSSRNQYSRIATIYGVLGSPADSIEIKDHYTTDETVIGTWIDGKPIYRLCGTFTTTKPTLPAMENVITARIYGKDAYGMWFPLPYANNQSTVYTATFYWNINGGQLNLVTSGMTLLPYYVYIFEYTKPSD